MTNKAPILDDEDREAIARFTLEYGETLKRLGVQIARWALFEGHSYFGRTDWPQTPLAHAVDALTVVLRESMADELDRKPPKLAVKPTDEIDVPSWDDIHDRDRELNLQRERSLETNAELGVVMNTLYFYAEDGNWENKRLDGGQRARDTLAEIKNENRAE